MLVGIGDAGEVEVVAAPCGECVVDQHGEGSGLGDVVWNSGGDGAGARIDEYTGGGAEFDAREEGGRRRLRDSEFDMIAKCRREFVASMNDWDEIRRRLFQ